MLPAELLIEILRFLPSQEVCRNKIVCSNWERLIRSNAKTLPRIYVQGSTYFNANGNLMTNLNICDLFYNDYELNLKQNYCLTNVVFKEFVLTFNFSDSVASPSEIDEFMMAHKKLAEECSMSIPCKLCTIDTAWTTTNIFEAYPWVLSMFDVETLCLENLDGTVEKHDGGRNGIDHFSYLVKHPELLRLSKASDIYVDEYSDEYLRDVSTDELLNFLIDQESYGNRECMRFLIYEDRNADFLEKYLEIFDHVPNPSKIFPYVCVDTSTNGLNSTYSRIDPGWEDHIQDLLAAYKITEDPEEIEQWTWKTWFKTRSDGWKMMIRHTPGQWEFKIMT